MKSIYQPCQEFPVKGRVSEVGHELGSQRKRNRDEILKITIERFLAVASQAPIPAMVWLLVHTAQQVWALADIFLLQFLQSFEESWQAP